MGVGLALNPEGGRVGASRRSERWGRPSTVPRQTLRISLAAPRASMGRPSHWGTVKSAVSKLQTGQASNRNIELENMEGAPRAGSIQLEDPAEEKKRQEKKRLYVERLKNEGSQDIFNRTLWYSRLVMGIVFIILELKLVPNPADMYGMMDWNMTANISNVTYGGGHHIDATSKKPWEGRSFQWRKDWVHSWDTDLESDEDCGFERAYIWTRNDGVRNPNVCFKTWPAWACLVISRSSAAMMYLFFTVVLMTKARYFLSCLQTTPFADYIPFHHCQELHNTAGKILLVDVWLHTCFHLIRFTLNADKSLFWASVTSSGWWGFICMNMICGIWNKRDKMTCPFRVVLSCVERVTGKLSFEFENWLHMSWVSFAAAMFYHRYRFGVYWVVCLTLMALDRFLERTLMTTRVPDIEVLAGESGTLLRFLWYNKNSPLAPEVELAGAIVRICLPKFSHSQYHPFSAFYDPYDVRYACVYINSAGDWTSLLHSYAQWNSRMPSAYVAGPCFSEFQALMAYRNILLVCSGTAITPVMGAAQYWEPGDHTVTLIWVTRDKSMLPLLLPAINPMTKVIIYYTGKAKNPVSGKMEQAELNEEDVSQDKFFGTRATTQNAVSMLKNEGVAKGLKESPSSHQNGSFGSFQDPQETSFGQSNSDAHGHFQGPPKADGPRQSYGGPESVEVIYGRPKDVEGMIFENMVSPEVDLLADPVVAISSGIIPFAVSCEKVCKDNGIPFVRCDASFG